MESWLVAAGLAVSLVGAFVLAVADAWLSRSMLVYLDAIEANVASLVEAVRAGGTRLKFTGMDQTRDRRQNSARALKLLGWLLLAVGFALQLSAIYLRGALL